MVNEMRTRLPGRFTTVFLGVLLAGCNSSAVTPTTTTTMVAETTTTTVAAPTTTTTVAPTTTTTLPATTTTLAPAEDPDHPFYDPYAWMDSPKELTWLVGLGRDFEEAMELLLGAAAQGGVVPKPGCNTVPLSKPCYEVKSHTDVDGMFHVVVIGLHLVRNMDGDRPDYYIEVRAEDPSRGWFVTKERFIPWADTPPPVWAR